jgi:hypothetical protein
MSSENIPPAIAAELAAAETALKAIKARAATIAAQVAATAAADVVRARATATGGTFESREEQIDQVQMLQSSLDSALLSISELETQERTSKDRHFAGAQSRSAAAPTPFQLSFPPLAIFSGNSDTLSLSDKLEALFSAVARYGPEHNTLEPEENCANCAELISEYWQYRSRTHKIATESGKAPVAPVQDTSKIKRRRK